MIRSERKIFCMQVGHFKLSLSLLSFVHFKRNGQLACENEPLLKRNEYGGNS